MFGFEKKKPRKKIKDFHVSIEKLRKKKTVRKVSTSAKKKAISSRTKSVASSSKNRERKKVSQSKTKVSKKTSKRTAQKATVKPKKRALKVGGKYFDSPQEVAAYYKAEGERVKKAMKRFKIDQAEGYLSVSKTNLMKVLSQKKNLGVIAQDLEGHKSVLNKKIADLNSQKEKGEIHKRSAERFVNKMKSLEAETKKLLDTKEQLIHREVELIQEMKELAKVAQRDLDLTDVVTANELAKFEMSKEAVLVKAKELLSEEMNKLFADNILLDRLDEKAVRRIRELNNQLAQIHGAKKETMKKRHVLEISEKETENALAQAESKVKKLEEKYRALLKK